MRQAQPLPERAVDPVEINVALAITLTALAGLSTGLGSIYALLLGRPRPTILAIILGFSAGVMLYVSFTELLGTAIEEIGFGRANIAFFAGILFIALVDRLVPHGHAEEHDSEHEHEHGHGGRSAVMRVGMFTAVGIAIHNLPEGLVVFSSAAGGDLALGTTIAIAVAIHNIPEGMAVSVPVLYATGSRRKAFAYSLLSGASEPVGALIGYAVLYPFITPDLMTGLRAAVAGIMIYISLDALLPMAHRYGREYLVITGIASGMAVMALSLFMLE